MGRIYLDHAATSPLLPEAREAMAPWLATEHGNPSSLYAEGRVARKAVDAARDTLSEVFGCEFGEVLFTSGGTEAANLAIVGSALANTDPARRRILFSAIEHHCVLRTRDILERLGFQIDYLPVDRSATVRLEALEAALGDDVLLVSVMHANNEVGTLQPVAEVSALAHRVGAFYHCDAVQTFLTVPWRVHDLGADMVTISAHKVGGPKGSGSLYVRAGVKIKPLAVGGGQEREVRAGTENVAAIVGLAAATKAAETDRAARMRRARDAFVASLEGACVLTIVDGEVLPGHAHIRCPGLSAESMLIVLDRLGVSASSGAACSSGSLEPSHVLLACGYTVSQAKEGLRFTFGPSITEEQARQGAQRVIQAAKQVRGSKDR